MTTEQDIKDYYNRHHRSKGDGSWRPAEAFPYFVDLAGVKSGESILDIGCGTGFLLVAAAGTGAKISGLDISDEALKLAGQSAPQADLRIGSRKLRWSLLPMKYTYQFIFLLEKPKTV